MSHPHEGGGGVLKPPTYPPNLSPTHPKAERANFIFQCLGRQPTHPKIFHPHGGRRGGIGHTPTHPRHPVGKDTH